MGNKRSLAIGGIASRYTRYWFTGVALAIGAFVLATCEQVTLCRDAQGRPVQCYEYVCVNGTPADGQTTTKGEEQCKSCNASYTKTSNNLCQSIFAGNTWRGTSGAVNVSFTFTAREATRTIERSDSTFESITCSYRSSASQITFAQGGDCSAELRFPYRFSGNTQDSLVITNPCQGASQSCDATFTATKVGSGFGYICANGTAASGTTPNRNTEKCQSCNSGYHLADERCVENRYTCTNGTAKSDSRPQTNNTAYCVSCNSGYKLDSNRCVAIQYTCSNGTKQSGNPTSGNADVERCTSCNSGFTLNSTTNRCDANSYQYTCTNGTAKEGVPAGNSNVEYCTACSAGWKLNNNRCNTATQYTCTNGTAKSGRTTSNNDEVNCISCNNQYRINGLTCVATRYLCTDGTARSGSPDGNADQTYCTSCNSGYKLTGSNSCTATQYTCSNGTAKSGRTTTNQDEPYCVSCSAGYVLDNNACRQPRYTCSNGTAKSGTPTGNVDVEYCTSCNGSYRLANNRCHTTPAAPATPTLIAGNQRITASWSAPSATGTSAISGYDVRYKLASESNWTSWSHSGTATTATITGLTNRSAYQVRVRAKNASGSGPWSASTRDTVGTTPTLSLSATTLSISEAVFYTTQPQGRVVSSVNSTNHVYTTINLYPAIDSNSNGSIESSEYNTYVYDMDTSGDFWASSSRLGSGDDLSANTNSINNSNIELQYRFGNSGAWSNSGWFYVSGDWNQFQLRAIVKTATFGNQVFSRSFVGSLRDGTSLFSAHYDIYTIDPTQRDKNTAITLNASDADGDSLTLKVYEGASATESTRFKASYDSSATPNGRLILIKGSTFDVSESPLTLTVEATDGQKSVRKTVTVTITN